MKPKHQRLIMAIAAIAALLVATLLAIPALRDTASYFQSPADIAANGKVAGKPIRLGGLVKEGTLKTSEDGLTINFTVTDHLADVAVRYTGIRPDLFKEGQGMIADGRFADDGIFVADTLLAKHDENYMPPEVADAVERAEAAAKARAE